MKREQVKIYEAQLRQRGKFIKAGVRKGKISNHHGHEHLKNIEKEEQNTPNARR